MITPNEAELQAICTESATETNLLMASLWHRGVQTIWLRQGALGSTLFSQSETISLSVPKITIVDSTGAGDAALAGWVFGIANGELPMTCLKLGHTLAMHILQRKGTVDANMNATTIYTLMKTYYND
jgi:sugar/nucleoside kinase (ribokinase family)